MRKEQDTPSQLPAKIPQAIASSLILSESSQEGYREILAGYKVRNKAGGPEMLLVGFTTETDYFKSLDTVKECDPQYYHIYLRSSLSSYQLNRLAMKIIINEHNEYGFCKNIHTEEVYTSTSYNNKGYGNAAFFCVCKYWSAKEEQFQYATYPPSELEVLV